MKKIFILIPILLSAFYFLISGLSLAQTPTNQTDLGKTKLVVPIPVPTQTGAQTVTEVNNLGQYIQTVYRFSLGIGGLFAVLFIVYGGIVYTVSVGNPSKQGEAKDIITNAVWGLVLLFGAFLILNTIDPRLVGLKISQPTTPSAAAPVNQQPGSYDQARDQAVSVGLAFEKIEQQRNQLVQQLGLTGTDDPNPSNWKGWDDLSARQQSDMARLNSDYFTASSVSIGADLALAKTNYEQQIANVSQTKPTVFAPGASVVIPSDYEKVQSAAADNNCSGVGAGLISSCQALVIYNNLQNLYALSVRNATIAQNAANRYR